MTTIPFASQDFVTSAIATAGAGYQPTNANLTTIAGLTATTDNFIVSVASAWASRTPAQVRTTLGLVIGTNVQAYDADLTTWAGITPGTGVGTALAVNVGSAGAFVTFNGALGTPSSGTLTNCSFPTLNQNTTGSAAKWTTARDVAGNSVDGSANVAFANKFIVQGTTDTGLSAAQFLGALGTGIVKNTTTTGVLSIAVAGDFPTLNQSTTGSAATLTTARAIYGNNFDGSAALGQVIASTYGGTGNGFTKFSGPTTAERTFTLPDASSTIVVTTRSISTTAPLTGGGDLSANRTLAIDAATTLAAGSMSAADKIKVDAQLAAVKYDATGAALGSAIADYFTSSISLAASSIYEIEAHAYFLKTTAGTVIWTWTFSSAPTMATSRWAATPVTGFTTSTITGTELYGQATAEAVAAMAHAASGSLTTAVRHSFMFRVRVRTNAATTVQLRCTESAGTVTPQAGSYMSAWKVV